jgi:hypothetical protein
LIALSIALSNPDGVPCVLTACVLHPTALSAALTPETIFSGFGAGTGNRTQIALPFGIGPGDVVGPVNVDIGFLAAATVALAALTAADPAHFPALAAAVFVLVLLDDDPHALTETASTASAATLRTHRPVRERQTA